RIGCVFQEGRLFPHLSVQRNLDYGRWMSGQASDPTVFRHAVELLDIGNLLDRRPGKLSGGERQRVAFGRALLMRPRLLLLDEPLASLDAPRKREILPYLEKLRDEVPMVYVSHHAPELKRIATSVVLLDAGRVAATGGIEGLDAVTAELMGKSSPRGQRYQRRRQLGAIPFSLSSLIALSFLARCASPIPRSTCGALVNWILSSPAISMRLPHGSRKSRNGPGSGWTPAAASARRAVSL